MNAYPSNFFNPVSLFYAFTDLISQSKIICYFSVLIFLLIDSGSHLQLTNLSLVFYNACSPVWSLQPCCLASGQGLISAAVGKGDGQDMEIYSIPPHVIARGKGRRESLLGRRDSFQSNQHSGSSQLEGMAGIMSVPSQKEQLGNWFWAGGSSWVMLVLH